MKKEFKVGDKIKFVGAVDSVMDFCSEIGHEAEVIGFLTELRPIVKMRWAGQDHQCTIHRRQITKRLIPKAPKPVEEKRVERWYYPASEKYGEVYTAHPQSKGQRCHHLVEIREGESICPSGSVPVSREALARAVIGTFHYDRIHPDSDPSFATLCKALGLSPEGGTGK